MGVVWEYIVSKIRCGRTSPSVAGKVTSELMSTREVSDASSDTSEMASEGYWIPTGTNKSVDDDALVHAMVPFTWEQGEIMQRMRCKALEICKYNGAHIRDNSRCDRLVRNNMKEIPKKRVVALHPSVANMVDISKTTSVDSLPPEFSRRRTRRRHTLATTVPVIYEADCKSRNRIA